MITQLTFLLVLVGLCYGKSDEEIRGWFFGMAVTCNKDYSIASDELAMMLQHKIPEGETVKCLMACVYRKADLMDDKGNYDLEKTNAWIATEFGDDPTRLENAKNLFNMCKTVNDETVNDGEKGCERAFHLTKCLTENAPKAGFEMP